MGQDRGREQGVGDQGVLLAYRPGAQENGPLEKDHEEVRRADSPDLLGAVGPLSLLAHLLQEALEVRAPERERDDRDRGENDEAWQIHDGGGVRSEGIRWHGVAAPPY